MLCSGAEQGFPVPISQDLAPNGQCPEALAQTDSSLLKELKPAMA